MNQSVKAPEKTYHTLDDIRERKEQLAADIQADNERFATLWSGLFTPGKASTKGEWVSALISNSITAVDAFLLVRKLMKNYGHLFGRRKRKL